MLSFVCEGRVTAFLRGSSFEPFLVELQRAWMPLVFASFPTESYYGGKPVEEFNRSNSKLFDWEKDFDDVEENESPSRQCKVEEQPTPR